MSNDLYQRQLEKAQKRLEHSSNCLAGLTKDRNAAVLSKKARKKLYKEYSDSIVKNIASGTDVAVNRKHLEKLAEKHSKHKKDVLQGNCLSAPLLEDVLQNEETESKAENWCSWEPEALPETMPDSMLQDNCPRMEEKSANKVALPMRVPEPAIKKAPKAQSLVELAGELKKYVHIISYGNILYYHNEYYYTQLDSNQLIKLYRQKIKVLALLPMELPKEIELDNTLEAMQNFVGGLIECIPLTDTDSEVTLVCNDEGKLLNLTPNRLLWNGADYLAGPGFIAGTDGEGNLASLPPQEMNYYAKKFRAFLIAL